MKRGAALLLTFAGAALMLAPAASAFECGTVLDNFSRASGTKLGPNWVEHAPDPAIKAQAFTVAAGQPGLATYVGASTSEACVDVAPGPAAISYAALVLSYAGLADNVFVKVQDNDANGAFDRVYFYRGNNTPPAWNPASNPHVVPPFSAARLHLVISGTTVTAELDTNFDNLPEQTIVEQSLPTAGLGTQIGLGAYGSPRLDNFAIPKKDAPPSFSCDGQTATLVGGEGRDVLNGTPGPDVIVTLAGNDLARGLAGKDLICGGDGKDKLLGGKGRDKLLGEAGKDRLSGGPKADECVGGPAEDKVKSC